MKKTLLILAASFVLALGASAAEAQKIATIDLRKVFDNYWRTKQADAKLKDDAGELERDRKIMVDQFIKNEEHYKKTIDGANAPEISTGEKEKRKREAEGELIGLRDLEQKIKTFDNTSKAQLGEKQRRIRDNILAEIRETIKLKVRAAGYTVVIDSAAETPNGTPIILFSTGADDLSDAVLKELNMNAPATPAAAPEKSPAK